MKILVYKGKDYDIYFDATDSIGAAFLAMFNYIDNLGYYGEDWMSPSRWLLVERARTGGKIAAHHLLRERRDHEYEGWSIENVI